MSENNERLSDHIFNFSQVKVMADNKLDIWGKILTLLLGQAWLEGLFTSNRRTWQMLLLWPEVNMMLLLRSKDDSDPRDNVAEEKHFSINRMTSLHLSMGRHLYVGERPVPQSDNGAGGSHFPGSSPQMLASDSHSLSNLFSGRPEMSMWPSEVQPDLASKG